jgi:hypothetical protein
MPSDLTSDTAGAVCDPETAPNKPEIKRQFNPVGRPTGQVQLTTNLLIPNQEVPVSLGPAAVARRKIKNCQTNPALPRKVRAGLLLSFVSSASDAAESVAGRRRVCADLHIT